MRSSDWARTAAILAIVCLPAAIWAAVAESQEGVENAKVKELVRMLGDDDPTLREEATEELIKMGQAAKRAVDEVAQSADAEVKVQAGYILPILKWDGEKARRLAESALKALGVAEEEIRRAKERNEDK